jgi:DnaK suppressor protein
MLKRLRKNTTSSRAAAPVKTPAKAVPAPKTAAKAAPAKAAAKATKQPAARVPAKPAAKAPAKSAVKTSPKAAPARSTPAAKKTATATTTAKAHAPASKPSGGAAKAPKAKSGKDRSAFLASQRQLLLDERANYLRSAETLKAQADSLALEHEPGDVQFDEEGGEGGTANVDREMDLVLSAQARAAASEIDRALEKIDAGTYGLCEQCGQPIPDARLQALPAAALCVACKSGGLSSRR